MNFVKKTKKLITELSRLCTISIIREGVVKLGFNITVQAEVASQIFSTVNVLVMICIIADILQVVLSTVHILVMCYVLQVPLELIGHREIGKAIALATNIASTAIIGFMAFGPVGICLGALAGFMIWGTGEVTGRYIDRKLPL